MDVWEKSNQYCKAIINQLKRNKYFKSPTFDECIVKITMDIWFWANQVLCETNKKQKFPTKVVYFLQFMDLYWHIIITWTPYFMLRFMLGVVHFMGLFKCILIFCQHYSIIQKIFTALKILCALSSHFSPKIIFLKPGIMQLLRQNSYRKKLKSAKPKICSPKLTIKNQD